MHLCVNGQVFSIGQLGPNFMILEDVPDLPPGEADIIMSIDGHEKRWTVFLPDGVVASEPRTRISRRQHPNGSTVG
jgi:hypothetical protein